MRRLIERVGFRRQRLFAAQPEAAERLVSLSRLAELAAAWTRREPHGSTRDFVRYLSAVADAGVELGAGDEAPAPGAVRCSPRRRSRASSSTASTSSACERPAPRARAGAGGVPEELLGEPPPERGRDAIARGAGPCTSR